MYKAAVIPKFTKAPQIVLDAARNGSFSDLMELANLWHTVPELLDMGVLEVFYGYLDVSEAPDSEAPESLASDLAYASILGLTRLWILEDDKAGRQDAEKLLKSWPGIFKWASYIVAVKVKCTAQTPQNRRSGMHILSGMLYAICKEESVRLAVLATPGALEMAASIWFFQDKVPVPSGMESTVCTTALVSLLRMDDVDDLDRAMAACDGKPDAMAKLVMKCIKTEVQRPAIDKVRIMHFMGLLDKFSVSGHPVQRACLAQGAVGTVTRGLLACIAQMAASQTSCLDLIVVCFEYIEISMQSQCMDGFTWVSEAVKAGLLLAFVNASPHYSKMDPNHLECIMEIIELVVPQYLVYRTVINNVRAALAIAQASPYIASVFQSPAKNAWEAFVRVAEDRKAFERESMALQRPFLICGNEKCLKAALREQFRKCSACETVNYCSKECQIIAWKEGDHKTMCKLQQQERIDTKTASVSKMDTLFIGSLGRRDASRNLAYIKAKAASTHPGMPLDALVVKIDYTCHPETYAVVALAGYDMPPEIPGAAVLHGLSKPGEVVLHGAMKDPGQYELIETAVMHGGQVQLLMTRNFEAPLPDTPSGELYDDGDLSAEVD